MRKKHENPEFQVIKMEQANAKFYAASSFTTTPNPQQQSPAPSGMNATGFDDNGGDNDIWNN